MKKFLFILIGFILCGNLAFADTEDGGVELQKQRDRLAIQKEFSEEYVQALETCSPFERSYSLIELNGERKIVGETNGYCTETIEITDKNNSQDMKIVCDYPKLQLHEIADSYKKLFEAEKKYKINTTVERGLNGIYKVVHKYNDTVITQPNYFFCKVQ